MQITNIAIVLVVAAIGIAAVAIAWRNGKEHEQSIWPSVCDNPSPNGQLLQADTNSD